MGYPKICNMICVKNKIKSSSDVNSEERFCVSVTNGFAMEEKTLGTLLVLGDLSRRVRAKTSKMQIE